MAITLQSNFTGSWVDISTLILEPGGTLTIGVNNTDAVDYDVNLWATGIDNLDPANVANRQGKEAVNEGWLECKLNSGSVWAALKFPASFPELLEDLAAVDGVFNMTAAASTRTLIDLRLTVGANPDTVGEVRFELNGAAISG